MRNRIVILFLFSLLIPNLVLASWYNPFSWFKQTAPSPVVQVSVPISNQTLPKNTGCHSDKGFNSITGALCGHTTVTTNPKKETRNAVPLHSVDPVSKAVVINSQKTALIADFLKSPTLENFKTFCAQAKNVTGNSTKQVLDSNRQNLITVKQTLYEEMIDCQRLDSNTYIYILPLDDSSLVPLGNSDTDKIRKAKITTNDKIKTLMTTSTVKIFGFQYLHGAYSPVQLLNVLKALTLPAFLIRQTQMVKQIMLQSILVVILMI